MAGVFRFACAQADAHVRAAPVADHDRRGQRHHGEGKHHRIRRIAIGAEIAGICDEELVAML